MIKQALAISIANKAKIKLAKFDATPYTNASANAFTNMISTPGIVNKNFYAILPTRDNKFNVIGADGNVIKSFNDINSAQAFTGGLYINKGVLL